jgi:hypothetical protein
LLGSFEIIAGIFGLACGVLNFLFGGIVAYVIAGIDVVMIGVVAFLIKNFSASI